MRPEKHIFKSNSLITASYRLSVQEQRILLACISQINPKNGDEITDSIMYTVKVSDIESLSGSNSKDLYNDIKEAANALFERRVTLTSWPNREGPRKARITRWVQSIEYDDKEGSVKLRFSTDIAPYLTNLSEQYTKYCLSDIAKINSAHAVRIFELMMQWKSVGCFTIDLEGLKSMLNIQEEYKQINDFKKRVIDISIKQISKNTAYNLSVTQKKTGRKVTHFIFTFDLKENQKSKKKETKSKKINIYDDKYLSQHARPGESKNDAIRRLKEKHTA